jgi:uncharacterized membrane protein YqjE
VSEHAGPTHPARPGQREPTVGEACALFVNQLATLAGREIALAKAELTAHARQFSMGGIALLAGALFGMTGWLALLAAAGLGIARALPGWLAALIIGAVLCLLAAAAAAWGARRLSGASRPLPMTTESIRRDLEVIRDGTRQ